MAAIRDDPTEKRRFYPASDPLIFRSTALETIDTNKVSHAVIEFTDDWYLDLRGIEGDDIKVIFDT